MQLRYAKTLCVCGVIVVQLRKAISFPAVTTSREHASRKGSSSSLSRRGEEET